MFNPYRNPLKYILYHCIFLNRKQTLRINDLPIDTQQVVDPGFFFKDFIYLFMRDTQREREREREAETQAEGEAGSMQRV